MPESVLARICAPAMAGIKPSNLAAVDKRRFPQCRTQLLILDRQFAARGIRFDILCDRPNTVLVLVYRPRVLEAALREPTVSAVLRMFGYDPDAPLDTLLDRLRTRLTRTDFPHEIGAFLGYPAADILGFLHDRREGVLLVGEWKVYTDAERAKKLFSRFAACRKAVTTRLANGKTLAQIFGAA